MRILGEQEEGPSSSLRERARDLAECWARCQLSEIDGWAPLVLRDIWTELSYLHSEDDGEFTLNKNYYCT